MHDLVIRDATIIDGSGAAAFRGDVAVDGQRIAALGPVADGGRRELDAAGRAVSPGFIDVHTHSDLMLLAEPAHEAKVRQGVTTDLLGLDGVGYAPLPSACQADFRDYFAGVNGNPAVDGDWETVAGWLSSFEQTTAINAAHHVPHGCVRAAVLGWEDRPPTPEETRRMQEITHAAFEDGAVALSSGLDYKPGAFADTEELIALSEVAARFNAPYATHLRYALGMREAIREAMAIGRCAGCPVHISHFYSAGRAWWVNLDEVERGMRAGVSVSFDAYSYPAGSSLLSFFFPDWATEGGVAGMLERLDNEEMVQRIMAEMPISRGRLVDWSGVQIAHVASERNRALEGQRVADAARARGLPPERFVVDLVRAERGVAAGIFFTRATEDDYDMILRHPGHMCSTDALLTGGMPHPRTYGTYPRYLGHFVRERGTISLEAMIWRMSGHPAQRFGLVDRGRLAPGMAADLVLFDPETVADRATFDEPKQFPVGIDAVIVNGVFVIDEGRHSGATPGRALRRAVPAV